MNLASETDLDPKRHAPKDFWLHATKLFSSMRWPLVPVASTVAKYRPSILEYRSTRLAIQALFNLHFNGRHHDSSVLTLAVNSQVLIQQIPFSYFPKLQ